MSSPSDVASPSTGGTTTAGPQTTADPCCNILILGASYGSLLATKFVLAGHACTLVCRAATAKVFNERGSVVRMPVRGREGLLDVVVPPGGRLTACTPDEVAMEGTSPAYDLVVLAMQEPQYSAPDVRTLVLRVAASGVPVMAVTNMPLPPYLERIPALRGVTQSSAELRACYTDPSLWDAFVVRDVGGSGSGRGGFDTQSRGISATHVSSQEDAVGLFTQCSPDPQAFRPPNEPPNVLQVRLPTNFKAAAFGGSTAAAAAANRTLERLERDVGGILYSSENIPLPVKLRVHSSVYVPLAKWAMLLAGNYRCVPPVGQNVRSIADAVNGDVGESRLVYGWVNNLVAGMGGGGPGTMDNDLVPFEKYLAATQSLQEPSSAARALRGGASHVERVDRVVQLIGRLRGEQLEAVDDVVRNVDDWLAHNNNNNNNNSSEKMTADGKGGGG